MNLNDLGQPWYVKQNQRTKIMGQLWDKSKAMVIRNQIIRINDQAITPFVFEMQNKVGSNTYRFR